MTANEHLESCCTHPSLSAETRERLRDVAFPDRSACTGNDLTCQCSWHQWWRVRDADDPYGIYADIARRRQEERQEMLAKLYGMIPMIVADAPELLDEHLDCIQIWEARRDEP